MTSENGEKHVDKVGSSAKAPSKGSANVECCGTSGTAVPLCVDLDGTLVRSDTFVEGILDIVCRPGRIFELPSLCLRGRARLKQRVAELAKFDPKILPYNYQLITWLREQKAAGRTLVLATGADARVAHAVANHLGLFDEVLCSDGVRNLKGPAKAKALVERFGRQGFAYAGNDRADLPVWKAACSIIIVNAGRAIRDKARAYGTVETEIYNTPSIVKAALRSMRPHQWVKNLLVFVPMVMAHAITETESWIGSLVTFVAFCAAASAIYIFNDLTDLSADRSHPNKRHRPLASGTLPVPLAIVLAVVLMMLGLCASVWIGVLPTILVYAITSTGYSFGLKEFPLVDVFMLAGLYTLRVIGGGIGSGHPTSMWLLGFAGFLFLSLALVKRTGEMTAAASRGRDVKELRRGYQPVDLVVLQSFGCAAAFASSVVLALFVNSQAALTQYPSPEFLWCVVPLILFWQCRLWLSSVRGYMHDDPIVYSARDWVTWIVVLCALVLLGAAAYGQNFLR
jgi:4-hydroxybenzoate polyprenyltransferase